MDSMEHKVEVFGESVEIVVGDVLGYDLYRIVTRTCAEMGSCTHCIIDLKNTNSFHFIGVGFIAMLKERVTGRGGTLELRNCPTDLWRMISPLEWFQGVVVTQRPEGVCWGGPLSRSEA